MADGGPSSKEGGAETGLRSLRAGVHWGRVLPPHCCSDTFGSTDAFWTDVDSEEQPNPPPTHTPTRHPISTFPQMQSEHSQLYQCAFLEFISFELPEDDIFLVFY